MFCLRRRFGFTCSSSQNVISILRYKKMERSKTIFEGYVPVRFKKSDSSVSSLFIPVPVKPNPDDINVGAELTGNLNKSDLLKVLNKFYQKPTIKVVAMENGLDSRYIVITEILICMVYYCNCSKAIII